MQRYKGLGIMSGTSLDGLDIALCEFVYSTNWEFTIEKASTINYSDYWISKLSNAHKLSGIDLSILHKEFGRFIGTSAKEFLSETNSQIDFIASHGHTVFHQPKNRLTLQIGDGAEIAAITNIKTVSDFRSLDVALGGQGAPLVPIGDKLLFSDYDYCINIGGFANISFEKDEKRLAYDISPANIILNLLAQKLNKDYDKDGLLGQEGSIDQNLLKSLNKIDYYKLPYPKSLGREWLNDTFIPIIDNSDTSTINKISTTYEHIAQQISNSIKKEYSKILITGGGAYNKHLINLIKEKTSSKIIIPNQQIIEFKEALIFAFLGLLRINKQNNTLASVTGATKDSSGGAIFHNKLD
jgi:anhydro-N-acetylmuramic acid kinase